MVPERGVADLHRGRVGGESNHGPSRSSRGAGTLPVDSPTDACVRAREPAPGESRVALTPEAAGKLGAAGFEIVVERGAGVLAGFPDGLYADAGAALSDHAHLAEGLDALVRVSPPNAAEVDVLPRGAVLIGFLQPLSDADGIARLEGRASSGSRWSRSRGSRGRSRWMRCLLRRR